MVKEFGRAQELLEVVPVVAEMPLALSSSEGRGKLGSGVVNPFHMG